MYPNRFGVLAIAAALLFAVQCKKLRVELTALWSITPALLQLALLTFVFLSVSGWIGCLLYGHEDPLFRDWVHATFQLVVLITTSNFPVSHMFVVPLGIDLIFMYVI